MKTASGGLVEPSGPTVVVLLVGGGGVEQSLPWHGVAVAPPPNDGKGPPEPSNEGLGVGEGVARFSPQIGGQPDSPGIGVIPYR